MDLSGKLIIKASLGDDIRRIPIHNEELTYDELILMMQRVFRGKLDTADDVTLKYKDEDGDLITIFDSGDVAFAIQYSRILKLTLFVNGKSSVAPSGPAASQDVKAELRAIRDRINKLLDEVSDQRPDAEGASSSAAAAPSANDLDALETKMASASVQQQPGLTNGSAVAVESKEFDPLQRANSIDSKGVADDQQSVSSQQAEQQPLQPQLQPQAEAPPMAQPVQAPPTAYPPAAQTPQQQLPSGVAPPPTRPPTSAMYPQAGFQRPATPASVASPRPAYHGTPPATAVSQAAPSARMPQQQPPAAAGAPPTSAGAGAPPTSAYQPQAQAPPTSAYQGYQGYQQQQQWQGQQQQQPQQPPTSAYQPPAAAAAPAPGVTPMPGAVAPLAAPPVGPPTGPPAAPGGANPYAKAPGQAFYR